MKQLTNIEKQAFEQQHPKKPTLCFQVVHLNVICYESNSPKLCQEFINKNNLIGAKIRSKR